MELILKKKLNNSCYNLRKFQDKYIRFNSNTLFLMNKQFKRIKKWQLKNISHACFSDHGDQIALLDTSGNFFIADINDDNLTTIADHVMDETAEPVVFNNIMYWISWSGKFYSYNFETHEYLLLENFEQDGYYYNGLFIDKKNGVLYIIRRGTTRKTHGMYLIKYDIQNCTYNFLSFPVKRHHNLINVIYYNNTFCGYNDVTRKLYFVQEDVNTETLILKNHFKTKVKGYQYYFKYMERYFIIFRSNVAYILDDETFEVLIKIEEQFISDVNIYDEEICVGTCEHGFIYTISE